MSDCSMFTNIKTNQLMWMVPTSFIHYKVLISISPIGFRTHGCLDPLFYYSLEMVTYYTAWYSLYLTLEFLCKEPFLINYLIILKYSLSIKMFLFSFTYSFEKKMSFFFIENFKNENISLCFYSVTVDILYIWAVSANAIIFFVRFQLFHLWSVGVPFR